MAPEGTRAAIRAAVRARAGMIELDVQMTREGRLIAFHDDRLDRTTDGTGPVASRRYVHVARLDAGRWFHRRFAGERILLVSQALRLVPRGMRVNLELKPTRRRAALLGRLLRVVRRSPGGKRRLLLSSFDPSLIRPLRRRGFAVALITRREPEQALRTAIRLGCASWHPFRVLATPRRIARAHAAGLRVYVWTVEAPLEARRLLRLGVDGIFTNDPARLKRGLRTG